MPEIIFYNWPDNTEREFRKVTKRLIDEGKTYREIVWIVQEVFVRIFLLKFERYKHFTDRNIFFKRHGLRRTTLNDWIKKHLEKY